MAHLISDEIEPNDGTCALGIFVTDINVSKEIYARGDMHVGGVMVKLVDAIGMSSHIYYYYMMRF